MSALSDVAKEIQSGEEVPLTPKTLTDCVRECGTVSGEEGSLIDILVSLAGEFSAKRLQLRVHPGGQLTLQAIVDTYECKDLKPGETKLCRTSSGKDATCTHRGDRVSLDPERILDDLVAHAEEHLGQSPATETVTFYVDGSGRLVGSSPAQTPP